MPTYKNYNMWNDYHKADLFLITTNSTIKKNGKLVMGAGIAKQARDRFPGIDLKMGKCVSNYCGNLGLYGLLISEEWPRKKLGLFQVKEHWNQKAKLNLIKRSLADLEFWLIERDDKIVCLPFPGIGNGKLKRKEVQPLLEFLPDNVWIYSL